MTPSDAIFQQLSQIKNVSRETFLRLEQFVALLEQWNSSINLVGKSTIHNIWQRHIFDSAQLLKYLPEKEHLIITDLGSGAGLPGMVIALLTSHEVHLVESDKRKAAFLQQASLLVPRKVFIHNARIESLSPWKSDVITSRALAPLPKLLELALPFCTNSSSCLFLKGVKLTEELSQCKNEWDMEVKIYPSSTAEHSSIVDLRHMRRKM